MDAFTETYRRYARDVHRFALWLAGPDDAEDVVAETFIRAWSRWERVRSETVKGYLLAIARSVVREKNRRRRPTEDLDPNLVDPRTDPEQKAVSRAELDGVLEALAKLPAPRR